MHSILVSKVCNLGKIFNLSTMLILKSYGSMMAHTSCPKTFMLSAKVKKYLCNKNHMVQKGNIVFYLLLLLLFF